MKLSLTIQADNAAFDPAELEIARILRVAADRIEAGQTVGRLKDYNGNTVGSFAVMEEE